MSVPDELGYSLHPASPPMLLVFAFVFTPMAMTVGAWSVFFPWLLPTVFGGEQS